MMDGIVVVFEVSVFDSVIRCPVVLSVCFLWGGG